MTIGEKIYELRSAKNMSLREFANETGLTHTTIARLESQTLGPQKIFLDTIYQICKKTHYDFGLFLYETGYLTKYPIFNSPNLEGLFSEDEKQIIEKYRSLPEQLKKLVRDQLTVFCEPSTIQVNSNNKR